MSIATLESEGFTPPTVTTTLSAPAPKRASLWLVDDEGNGVGKPIIYDLPIAEVHGIYYNMTQQGGQSTCRHRITATGKRPAGLGRTR